MFATKILMGWVRWMYPFRERLMHGYGCKTGSHDIGDDTKEYLNLSGFIELPGIPS